MLRKLKEDDLLGKPGVNRVECDAINSLRIFFTDNSFIELWAEDAVHTPAGYIPGIFIEDTPEKR